MRSLICSVCKVKTERVRVRKAKPDLRPTPGSLHWLSMGSQCYGQVRVPFLQNGWTFDLVKNKNTQTNQQLSKPNTYAHVHTNIMALSLRLPVSGLLSRDTKVKLILWRVSRCLETTILCFSRPPKMEAVRFFPLVSEFVWGNQPGLSRPGSINETLSGFPWPKGSRH